MLKKKKEEEGGGERKREREREPRLATAFESSRRRYFDCERSEVLGQVST